MVEIAAVILAAGRATRWRASGGVEATSQATKLVADFRGQPIVRAVAQAALASRARPAFVVVGHEAQAVRAALDGLAVTFVDNPHFAEGLSTSLRAGLSVVPARCAGAVILLADMPEVSPQLIDALIEGFEARPGARAAAPRRAGGLGNPALLARATFDEAMALSGDRGARGLIEAAGAHRVEVAWPGAETALDIDDVAAWRQARDKGF